jgi:hypothetical protein
MTAIKTSLKERVFMMRTFFHAGAVAVCAMGVLVGCGDNNPVTPKVDPVPAAPTGATAVFAEGFGGDVSKWMPDFMILANEPHYPRMKITTAAAHTGTHSLTSDSNKTALCYMLNSDARLDKTTCTVAGVEFYIMAKALGQANFTVEFGQNAGSSGGLSKAFGLGFDPNDSLKCTYSDTYFPNNNGHNDSNLAGIQVNRWYKCAVEVDFTAKTISYFLDDAKIRTLPLPTQEMYGIDRVLVFRGDFGGPMYDQPSKNGAQPYYVDDIVLYKK